VDEECDAERVEPLISRQRAVRRFGRFWYGVGWHRVEWFGLVGYSVQMLG
jgi:hypothetical protein